MGMVSRQDLVTLSAAAALGGGLMAIAFSAGAHWNQLQSLGPVAVVSEIAGGEEEAAARRKKFALQKWFRSMFNLPPPRLVGLLSPAGIYVCSIFHHPRLGSFQV
jgi:hypothetical protein